MLSERIEPLSYRGETIERNIYGYYIWNGVTYIGDLLDVLLDIDESIDGETPAYINDDYMTEQLWAIVNAQSDSE